MSIIIDIIRLSLKDTEGSMDRKIVGCAFMSKAAPIVHPFDPVQARPLNPSGARPASPTHPSAGNIDMSSRDLSATSIVLLFGLACITPACGRAGRKFKQLADETTLSPDRQIRIEQYSRDLGDWNIITHSSGPLAGVASLPRF